jgi:hypothetical protein
MGRGDLRGGISAFVLVATLLFIVILLCSKVEKWCMDVGYMKKRSVIISLVLFSLLVLQVAHARAEDPPGQTECATLLLTKCDSCHYLTRVCYRVGKKNRHSWQRTLNAMVRHGAQLTTAEQDTLLACLSDAVPEVEKTCREYLGH